MPLVDDHFSSKLESSLITFIHGTDRKEFEQSRGRAPPHRVQRPHKLSTHLYTAMGANRPRLGYAWAKSRKTKVFQIVEFFRIILITITKGMGLYNVEYSEKNSFPSSKTRSV